MTERWLPIAGFEGRYEVSDEGRVRTLPHRVKNGNGTRVVRPRIRRPSRDKDGYQVIILSGTQFRVSRLVLETFVGPAPDGTIACHGPIGNISDALTNLRWDTFTENLLDAVRQGNHFYAKAELCVRGHQFDRVYTYPSGRKQRVCDTCKRERRQRKGIAA